MKYEFYKAITSLENRNYRGRTRNVHITQSSHFISLDLILSEWTVLWLVAAMANWVAHKAQWSDPVCCNYATNHSGVSSDGMWWDEIRRVEMNARLRGCVWWNQQWVNRRRLSWTPTHAVRPMAPLPHQKTSHGRRPRRAPPGHDQGRPAAAAGATVGRPESIRTRRDDVHRSVRRRPSSPNRQTTTSRTQTFSLSVISPPASDTLHYIGYPVVRQLVQ